MNNFENGVVSMLEAIDGTSQQKINALILHNLCLLQGVCATQSQMMARCIVLLREGKEVDRDDFLLATREMAQQSAEMLLMFQNDTVDFLAQLKDGVNKS